MPHLHRDKKSTLHIEEEVAKANKNARERKKAAKDDRDSTAPATTEAVPDEVEEVAPVVSPPPPSKKTLHRRERKENEMIRRAVDAACEDAPCRKDGQVVDDPTHSNMKALSAALIADEKNAKAKAKAKATAKARAGAVDVYTSVFT